MKKIVLLFDCIRAPYDIANILQVALALGCCEIHFSGNSIRHDHHKVAGKVFSWSKKYKNGEIDVPVTYHKDFLKAVAFFKKKKYKLVGTSPHATKIFYELDFNKDNYLICFGAESSGFSKEKMKHFDELVKIPMEDNLEFMTLSVVVPVVAYEIYRQFKNEKKLASGVR